MAQQTRRQKLERVQYLIGEAKGSYLDDISPNRAEKVLAALDEAFELMIDIISSMYP